MNAQNETHAGRSLQIKLTTTQAQISITRGILARKKIMVTVQLFDIYLRVGVKHLTSLYNK